MTRLMNFHAYDVIRVTSQLTATVVCSGDVVTQQWQKPCLLLNFNLNAVKIIFNIKNLL